MNKLLNLLRKLGILHIGGKTYKGRNVGGDYSTADIDTSWKKEKGKDEGPSDDGPNKK